MSSGGQAQANRAIADEAARLATEITDKHLRAKQMMEKFDALIDEGNWLGPGG